MDKHTLKTLAYFLIVGGVVVYVVAHAPFRAAR